MSGATAKQFAEWDEKYSTYSMDALLHVKMDCLNASKAMKDHNEELEMVYWDEYLTVIDIILRKSNRKKFDK